MPRWRDWACGTTPSTTLQRHSSVRSSDSTRPYFRLIFPRSQNIPVIKIFLRSASLHRCAESQLKLSFETVNNGIRSDFFPSLLYPSWNFCKLSLTEKVHLVRFNWGVRTISDQWRTCSHCVSLVPNLIIDDKIRSILDSKTWSGHKFDVLRIEKSDSVW